MKIIIQYYRSLLLAIIIMVLSLMPIKSELGSELFNIPYSDKIAHFGLYGLLSFLLLYELHRINASFYKMVLLPILICLVYGGLIELIQMFVVVRSAELFDLVADLAGGILAIPAFYTFKSIFPSFFHKDGSDSTRNQS